MGKTKYQVIADDIRNKIILKEYLPDTVIPSELQMQEHYGVSRHTVREAVMLLVNEGYLRKRKGSGTYVNAEVQKLTNNQTTSKTIGVITTYISDYIFPNIIRGIEEGLRSQGYSLMLASTGNDYEQEKNCLEQMIKQGVQGLIVEPTKSNQFNPNLALYASIRNSGIPIVMINAVYEELNIPSISLDDVQSGFLATESLIKHGHENLMLISKVDDLQGKLRMKGFFQACEEYKMDFSPGDIISYTTETIPDVPRMVVNHLKNNPDITGIVGYNDQIVYSVISQLIRKDYRIPEDISIIGNDNFIASTPGQMQLSTIQHPKEKMGLDAANWVINAIDSKKNGSDIQYPAQLVEGTTIKKIK